MNKKLTSIIVTICLTGILSASSIFSFGKFPLRTNFADVYGIGLGGASIGDLHRINVSYANPSLSLTTNKVSFATAVKFGFINYKDEDTSFRDDNFEAPYFNIIIPVKDNRFFFNFNKYLSGNSENIKITDNFEESQKIDSYIYNVDFGYAYKTKFVNLGLKARVFLGHYTHQFEQNFTTDDMLSTKFEKYGELKNISYTFGASKKFDKLSLGGYFSAATKLTGMSEFLFSENVYSVDLPDNEFEVPNSFGFGLAYRSANRLKYVFDYEFENWSTTDSYQDAQNSNIMKAGIAYDPLWGYGEWWQRIPLRVGMSYRNLPFKINDNNIDEISGTFGLSIPLKKVHQKIDLGLVYTQRGNQDNNGISENSFMLNIGIQGFDIFHRQYNRTRKVDIPQADEWSN